MQCFLATKELAFHDLNELNFNRYFLPAHSKEPAKKVIGNVVYDFVKDRGLTQECLNVQNASKCVKINKI